MQVLDYSGSAGQFWGFSWWEMGEADIPAVVETVLATTGNTQ